MYNRTSCVPRSSCYTGFVALKNVTITLDETVARWARIRAAERNTSVSRLVGQMIEERMAHDDSYEQAKQAFFAVKPVRLGKPGEKLPTRQDLYDRPVLRRH